MIEVAAVFIAICIGLMAWPLLRGLIDTGTRGLARVVALTTILFGLAMIFSDPVVFLLAVTLVAVAILRPLAGDVLAHWSSKLPALGYRAGQLTGRFWRWFSL